MRAMKYLSAMAFVLGIASVSRPTIAADNDPGPGGGGGGACWGCAGGNANSWCAPKSQTENLVGRTECHTLIHMSGAQSCMRSGDYCFGGAGGGTTPPKNPAFL
jgi:hypothetical protein